jgi:hypothetical protein
MLAVFTSFQPHPVLPIGLSSLARIGLAQWRVLRCQGKTLRRESQHAMLRDSNGLVSWQITGNHGFYMLLPSNWLGGPVNVPYNQSNEGWFQME